MNSNLTRGGIAYDFVNSPYRYNVIYEDGKNFPENITGNNITFVFSSKLYRGKFIKEYKSNRKKINNSLSNRFGFSVEFNILADLKLYCSIEKRGFLIYQNGEAFECLNSIILDGEKMTRQP